MKKTINYEKDILFKTNIGEITSISLEHDFTIDMNVLKGDFIVCGEYKANELSVNKEPFSYRLPLEYELDENMDIDSITYDIDNFEYNVHNDELNIYIDLGIKYQEKKGTQIQIPEEEQQFEVELDNFLNKNETIEDKIESDERLNLDNTEIVSSAVNTEETYITYHVHILKEGETLEEICKQYNSSIELVKEYNNIDNLTPKSKIIVPEL